MRRLYYQLRFVLLLGTLLFSAGPMLAQDADLVRHFDYDQKAPLGLKELGVEKRGDVRVHDSTDASPTGGVVPAYLVVPNGKGSFAPAAKIASIPGLYQPPTQK